MKDEKPSKFIGGWFRVFLGILQMTLAGAAALTWLSGGSERVVWLLAIAALVAVIISRMLYRSK
jgi:hypothetical protein